MITSTQKAARLGSLIAVLVCAVFCVPGESFAQNKLALNKTESVVHVNGMRFQGRVGSLPKMGTTLADLSADSAKSVVIMVDDDLREIFMSRFNVANMTPVDLVEEEFEIWQKVHEGATASEIGAFFYIGPFDEWGRRTISVETAQKVETIFQGITRINPRYVRLEGVVNSLGDESAWDMRMALSAVPTDVLVKVLERQIKDVDDANERLRLVDFYVQAQKYRQAEAALRSIERDFPGLREEMKDRGEQLRGQIARQIVQEANLRRESGQPQMAQSFLQFKNSVGIASAVVAEIRQSRKLLRDDAELVENTRKLTLELTDRVLADESVTEELRNVVTKFAEEVKSELGFHNAVRLSTFVRLSDDASLNDQQKLSIALSGWVLGAGSAIENIGESQSLLKTRQLVIEYLQSKRPERRDAILAELETIETGAPQYLDKIVKQILPPLAPSPAEIQTDMPMEMEIEIPSTAGKPPRKAKYLIQLPPEYDPYRRYPCIVTLGGNTQDTTPQAQINYWCGPLHPEFKIRTGHAARRGYIVIAPNWMDSTQTVYTFTDKEHAAVLGSLRHATKRFSIDTDRVFLSGHYAGAVAAWDIGQAHPEHWTGVIPISARCEKYIKHYSDNGKFHTKWYFVNGARDYPSRDANAKVWNDRMRSRDFDTIIVYYKGRGTEKFADDLPNIFQWMAPQRRQFDVRNFECSTMRPWDNYFWWVEFNLRGNKKMRLPEEPWTKSGLSDWIVEGSVPSPNTLRIRGVDNDATVWLLPEIIDFNSNIVVDLANSKNDFKGGVKPSRRTLLEDVRTRGDRQHPYWAKVVRRNKRWAVEE